MGIRGQKPKPTNLRLMHGNPGKRPLPRHEPKPKERKLRCPAWLPSAAKREWAYIVPKLAKLRVVTELDRAVLEAYCTAYARWREVEEKLAAEALTLDIQAHQNAAGKQVAARTIQNPLVQIADKARRHMHAALSELGLSPSSRTRIMTTDRGSPDDPLGILR